MVSGGVGVAEVTQLICFGRGRGWGGVLKTSRVRSTLRNA